MTRIREEEELTAGSRSAGTGSLASVVDSRGVGTSFSFSVCSQRHNHELKLCCYREARINREKSLKLPCRIQCWEIFKIIVFKILLKILIVYLVFSIIYTFYRATRMHSADYAVARCLSVCLSVCPSHAGIESKRLYISSTFFSPLVSLTFLVFPHQTRRQCSDGDPLTGASNVRGMKKSRLSTNISPYLANDAR